MPQQLPLLSIQPAAGTTLSDGTDRAAAIERLRAKLSDPAFRAIEGFPIGEDEAILALSDPPYYTVCPNPFLPEIVALWQECFCQTKTGPVDNRKEGWLGPARGRCQRLQPRALRCRRV